MTVLSILTLFGLKLIHLTNFLAFVTSVYIFSIFGVFRAEVIKFMFECREASRQCFHHGTPLTVALLLFQLFEATFTSNFVIL